jgi:hypothetical protein
MFPLCAQELVINKLCLRSEANVKMKKSYGFVLATNCRDLQYEVI